MLIPRGLLAAPADGGAEPVDVLVVGSGVAGLSAALAVPAGRSVLLATKDRLGHSAARYAQGGIAAEAACTGVHGANRLASNSLLEGVVFAARIGNALTEEPRGGEVVGPVDNPAHPMPRSVTLPEGAPAAAGRGDAWAGSGRAGTGRAGVRHLRSGAGDPRAVRERVRRVMTDRVGVVRSGEGLAAAMAELAIRREESRGGHWRSDHPVPVEAWRVRQTFTRSPDGGLDTGLLAVPTAEEARR